MPFRRFSGLALLGRRSGTSSGRIDVAGMAQETVGKRPVSIPAERFDGGGSHSPVAGFAPRTGSHRKIQPSGTGQAAIFSSCTVSLRMVRTSTGRCFLTGDIMASCLTPTMFPLSSNMQVRIFACCMFRIFPVSRRQNPAVSSRLTGCGQGMYLSGRSANRSVL